MVFRDRTEAARKLARKLKIRDDYCDALVLAIPRGGVVVGAALAQELAAELDVLLVRKLRAPFNPELAIGAISETGAVFLNRYADDLEGVTSEYVARERQLQYAELERRRELFRAVRPPAPLAGRSIIITDDGLATGSTMMAALQVIRAAQPAEIIVALPVLPDDRVAELERQCDEVVYLTAPSYFRAVGQFYGEFPQLEDDEVVELLRKAHESRGPLTPTTTTAS